METIEELKKQAEELKSKYEHELSAIQKKIEEVEQNRDEGKKRGRWKPYENQYYFAISINGFVHYQWRGDEIDNNLYSIGNVFRTIEDAKFEEQRLKVIAKMKEYSFEPNWNDKEHLKYVILYNHRVKNIEITSRQFNQNCDIFFKDKVDCQKCIDEVGEENIKKYYFRIKDCI